ncbi:peptidoglycan DD-metalloendopeptidase family protein [Corynebacterium callunae]|uniref:NlpC/P60 domain-containing protein n=1 Tax=Corynebacterium callunae DSM 20147 TaxID=1121353 RepID=M1UWK9_9CORY|nr:peptidoglycan DD-metalloendopeptidase family protein [Corynebacterium callunae]AGG68092.1 hypothetical protein H924_13515 [Corynebacterium callunae DSM 20147]
MKKVIALVIAIVMFLILMVVTMMIPEKDLCVAGSSSGGSVVVNGDFAYPSDKDATTVTSGFGARWGENHNGVDLAGPAGTPIYAFADGRVIAAADSGVQGFGGWVVLEHNIDGKQIQTVYGHEEPGGVHVKVGDNVTKGQHIADIGNAGQSTGAHLHFEVIEGDRAAGGKAVDPQPWIDQAEKGVPESSGSADVSEESGGFAGLNARQLTIAKQIVAIGEMMGVDQKGQEIAVATAKHESQLKVYANDGSGAYQSAGASGATPEELRKSLDYPHDAVGHDHASVGTFQQQVGFWGTVEELMNPAINAKKFYEALGKVDYRSMSVGQAASTVQGNATGTGVYESEAGLAAQLVEHFKGSGSELSPEEIEALGNAVAPAGGDCGQSSSSEGGALAASGMGGRILSIAQGQFGHPYVWGGGDTTGPTSGLSGGEKGFDCSGFVLYAVFKASGGTISLPHNTVAQMNDPHLKPVSWEDRQPGDLIYVGEPGQEHHVAIYSGLENGTDMWVEAQDFGVPSGKYPVRHGEKLQVMRIGE